MHLMLIYCVKKKCLPDTFFITARIKKNRYSNDMRELVIKHGLDDNSEREIA